MAIQVADRAGRLKNSRRAKKRSSSISIHSLCARHGLVRGRHCRRQDHLCNGCHARTLARRPTQGWPTRVRTTAGDMGRSGKSGTGRETAIRHLVASGRRISGRARFDAVLALCIEFARQHGSHKAIEERIKDVRGLPKRRMPGPFDDIGAVIPQAREGQPAQIV
jgi:hypothetical protein